jgi:LacI family transcriptional regulator
MDRRVKVEEIVAVTGFSRATVDRVLNGRPGVRPRTKQLILDAKASLSRIGAPRIGHLIGGEIDVVMRLGSGLGRQLIQAGDAMERGPRIVDLYQKDEDEVHEQVANLCRDPNRPLIVAVKNTERICRTLMAARLEGKRIVSMVSDLNSEARDAFVGIDNRRAGQTAAFIIGGLLRGQQARVGIVLGSHSFRCHEDREIGFRSYLRTAFPHLSLADIALGEDSPDKTYEAVGALLRSEPNLMAIYNVGGGNRGLAEALVKDGRAGSIFVVTHETNHITAPLAQEGILHFLIGQNSREMLERATQLARRNTPVTNGVNLLDFFIFTKFSMPAWQAFPADPD